MKDARHIVKLTSLILFTAFTSTKLIQYVSDITFAPIFFSLSFVLGIVFFIGNKKLLDAGWSFATSAEIIIIWDLYWGNLSAITGVIFFILLFIACMLFLRIQKYPTGVSLFNSLTAFMISSTLLVITSGTDYLLLSALLFPVACSIIYILWSGRFNYGVPILISNSIISLTLFYVFMYFLGGQDPLAVLIIGWSSILCISLSFNQNNSSIFKFGYKRFQNEKQEIQQDIQRLKWNIANEKQLQSEELLQIMNQLKNVQKEKSVKEILGRTIQRYQLHEKVKLMETYTFLITASASSLYISSALYLYSVTKVSPTLLIGSYFLYTGVLYFLSKSMMKNWLINFINQHIIMPFNKIVVEREKLILTLKALLEERGVSTVMSWEMEDIYYSRATKQFEQRDISLILNDQPITE